MDYDSTLGFLQNLLTTKQGTQAQQFNSNTEFANRSLGQQGQQFNAQLALQKAIQDWAQNSGQQGLDLQKRQQQGDFLNLDFQNSIKERDSLADVAMKNFQLQKLMGSVPASKYVESNSPVFGFTDVNGKYHAGWN